MFYVTLRNKGYYDTSGAGPQTGWGPTNTGPFGNLASYVYWSGTEHAALLPNTAWEFRAGYGDQDYSWKFFGEYYAWAVRPGDAAAPAVPLPAALPLFASALAGFGVVAARRRR